MFENDLTDSLGQKMHIFKLKQPVPAASLAFRNEAWKGPVQR